MLNSTQKRRLPYWRKDIPSSVFSGGGAGFLSAAATWSAGASELTITATTTFNLASGRFGARISVGEGSTTYVWFDGAGAASSQSLVITQAALEAQFGALPAACVLNVDPGYSLTDPAVVKVYASTSGVYPTPVVYTASVDDTTPTESAAVTGTFDKIVGPILQVITESWYRANGGAYSAIGGATAAAYTPVAGDVGYTLKFRSTSTLGALTAYDESDATSAVVSAGPPATDRYGWYKFNAGITEAGTGVSAWADADASGRNLVQADDAKRPTKEVDGSITFNGTSDGLAASFTLAQPYVVYIKYKSLGWTSTDRIYDGPVNRASLQQTGTDPDIQLNAGAGNVGTKEVSADGSYHIVRAVWNGASSILEVDATAPETINPGTNSPGGFSLAANGTVSGQWANVQVKEVIIYNNTQSAGDTTATLAYLATV